MIVVDTTRRRQPAPLRAWKRRLHGAVGRALRSSTPPETWRAELPALTTAAGAAWLAILEEEHHKVGRTMSPATAEEMRVERSRIVPAISAVMGPARAAKLLHCAGIDLERAMRLCQIVGGAVADAVSWLDVVDVVLLDEQRRGAA